MASNSGRKNLLLSFFLYFLVLLDLTLSLKATGTYHQRYEGKVGGNVTLYCPVDSKKTLGHKVALMYLQIRTNSGTRIFVNGYYNDKPMPAVWENTQLDRPNLAVRMTHLNVSHNGDYECVIRYTDETDNHTLLHLSVTAPYKSPMVTNSCKEEKGAQGCHVTCEFHEGFPLSKIQWDITGTVNSSDKIQITDKQTSQCPITKLFNISSTAYFNCSSGEQKVSCSVGGVVSESFSVCISEAKPVTAFAIAAVAILLLVSVLAVICLKRQPEPPESNGTTNLEEGLSLTEIKRETEAS